LDLNLLVAFDALVTTRSIARTAQRLHLSEPAISAALGRLRDFFEDELLVREGKGFNTTVAALALLPLVRQCLRDAEVLIDAKSSFAPESTERCFRIIASDYSATALLTRVAESLHAEAPNVTLEILPPVDSTASPLQTGAVDLVICPEPYMALDHPSEVLFNDEYVFGGWSGNPIFETTLTLHDIESSGHVKLQFGHDLLSSYGDQQLDALGINRRVEVICGSFSTAPWFLLGTMRLALMYKHMALRLSRIMPIAFAAPPFPTPSVPILLQYHRSRRDDAGSIWLRNRIHACAGNMTN
jgi:DNA-binding transcriptional LysR family regulator